MSSLAVRKPRSFSGMLRVAPAPTVVPAGRTYSSPSSDAITYPSRSRSSSPSFKSSTKKVSGAPSLGATSLMTIGSGSLGKLATRGVPPISRLAAQALASAPLVCGEILDSEAPPPSAPTGHKGRSLYSTSSMIRSL